MNWGGLLTLFGLSIIKFMFAPFSGPVFNLTFIETYTACVAGAIISAVVFFYSANYFMHRSKEKRDKKRLELIKQGVPYIEKKKFSKTNKFVVRMKRSIGIVGISFWAPFFLSIPLGSIIVAKFYGDDKRAFPLIIVGIFLNGIITTGITYFSYG